MRKLLVLILFSNLLFASVGYFVIVRGDVEVKRDSQVLKAKSGMQINNKDEIVTKGAAKAQIKFNDDTIVSLGKNTIFRVEDYINDTSDKKLHMGVSSGSFKVITGGIAKTSRDNFVFVANTAVIGVRGTIFAGEVGIKNKQDTIGCVQGAIDVRVGDVVKQIDAGVMVEIQGSKIINVKSLDSSKIETINSINSQKIDTKDMDVAKQELINIKASGDKDAILKAKQEYIESKKKVYDNTNASYRYYEQSYKVDSKNPYYDYSKQYGREYDDYKNKPYQSYQNGQYGNQNYQNNNNGQQGQYNGGRQ